MKDEQEEYSTLIFFSSKGEKGNSQCALVQFKHFLGLQNPSPSFINPCSPPRKGKKKGR